MVWPFTKPAVQSDDAIHFYREGGRLLMEGQPELAVAELRRAVRLAPGNAEYLKRLGDAQGSAGRPEAAIDSYHAALVLRPDFFEAARDIGVAWLEHGDADQAEFFFRAALGLDPASVETCLRLAALLRGAGRHEEAVALYVRVIALQPRSGAAHNDLGNAYSELNRLQDAEAAYERAIELDPQSAEAHFNLAVAVQKSGETERAIAHYSTAIRIRPDFFDAHFNLGFLFVREGDAPSALQCYAKAIALRPDLAEAHFNYALLLLLSGQFAPGWKEYEWRWRLAEAHPKPAFSQPEWNGSDLNGATILLYAEQGFGDAVQFARYATLLHRRGARTMVRCARELKALLATVPGVSRTVTPDEPAPPFDVHFPLLSLPRAFGTTADCIPAHVPYLRPSDSLIAKWRNEVQRSAGQFKAGLVWAAQSSNRSAQWRSIRLRDFAPLSQAGEVAFYSLQKGEAGRQSADPPAGLRIIDLTDKLDDFAETAALVSNLDLVISVDTAVAHVAGGLGKPVWTLLPFAADWRWLEGREDSAWYPSMRLFRQQRAGDWHGLIVRVAQELRRLTQR